VGAITTSEAEAGRVRDEACDSLDRHG
jgi:hypothetical protein